MKFQTIIIQRVFNENQGIHEKYYDRKARKQKKEQAHSIRATNQCVIARTRSIKKYLFYLYFIFFIF